MGTIWMNKFFISWQCVLLSVAAALQVVMVSDHALNELGVMEGLFHWLGVLRLPVLLFCIFTLYQIIKRRRRHMEVIFIQGLGLIWGLNSYYVHLSFVGSAAALKPQYLWQYYISLLIAAIYALTIHAIAKKRARQISEESAENQV